MAIDRSEREEQQARVEAMIQEFRAARRPTLTITSQHPSGETLTIAVDDGDLSVHTMSLASRPVAGLHGGVRCIDCSRTDRATAAYLVQDWMARI